MYDETNNVQPIPNSERGNNMTKKTMCGVLRRISNSAEHSGLVGVGGGSCLLFIQTHNKLRAKALANGWIDGDIVIELDTKDTSIFTENVEWMDVVGAAAEIFRGFLDEK